MNELTSAWREYLDVLAVEAPVTRAAILPPAELDLAAAEKALRSPLLPELVTWFGLHGGSGYTFDCAFLPFCMPNDLPGAVKDSVMIRDIWQEDLDADDLIAQGARAAGTVAGTWLDPYVMIAEDGSGGGLFVDQRPGPLQGCVRWWDKVESDNYEDGYASPSLLQLITDLAPAVRDRTPVIGWVPEVVDGALDWDVAP